MKNSKEVDWNEAPEGSTHYNRELKCSWLKETPPSFYNNGFWDEYILDEDSWEVHFSNAIKRPQEFLKVVYESEKKRHVRKDFNPEKGYNVDVSNCTIEEKEEIQQAFFDVGILWFGCETKYRDFDALQYSNQHESGSIIKDLMYGSTTEDCNISPQEFLDLVYEPEQQGHIHAESMAKYAEDAKTTKTPWELWQVKCDAGIWQRCQEHPKWVCTKEYRRETKTRIVHGVELPVFEFTPKVGERFYAANVGLPEFFEEGYTSPKGCTYTQRMIERGLLYPFTEEGKQAAILHAKTMLGTGN